MKIMKAPVKMFNEWRKHALLQQKKKFIYEKPNQAFGVKSESGIIMLSSGCTFFLSSL